MLLEEWLNKEVSFGDLGDVSLVQKKAPRKVKRKRPIPTEDGSTLGYALRLVLASLHCSLKKFALACVASLSVTNSKSKYAFLELRKHVYTDNFP